MKRSQRLQPLIKLAADKEQAAAQKLGAAQQQVAAAQQQLVELRQYRLEYRQQALRSGASGIGINQYIELQRFIAHLDSVIQQQELQLQQRRQEVERCRQLWQQMRAKQQGLAKMSDKLRDQEEVAEARREQKANDEFAQRGRR